MLNTFYDGDLVVTQCMTKSYNYNDVVVLDSVKPNQVPIIKRIIGVEGDTIDIDNETGTVIRNGVPLIEEYARTKTYTRAFGTQFPLQVEQGKLFLLGDNRDISKDSRSAEIGQVEIRDIWGKVIFNVNRKLK